MAVGRVVPADHVRVPAPPPGVGGLGLLDIAFNMWALIFVGPVARAAARPVRFLPSTCSAPSAAAVMFYFLAPPYELRWAPPARSSGCSARGSWCQGGCRLDSPAGSSC